MDPQACYEAWLVADEADQPDHARDYNGWLRKGGFPAIDQFGQPVPPLPVWGA